jgi:SAM-dependent methyltransferase
VGDARVTTAASDAPPGVELEDCDCPLGCPRDDEVVLDGARDRLHDRPGRYRIVRCRACGLMRTNPRPTPATIGFYYPPDYGPYGELPAAPDAAAVRRPWWKRWLRPLLLPLLDHRQVALPPGAPGRALEIGCASGWFLHELRRSGWEAEGIEFSPEVAARARALGFPVQAGRVETVSLSAQRYDLVVGWMVLEHLHEPVVALRKLHEGSRPGARLAISVPDCGGWEMRVFRDRWFALQVPAHLFHYDRRTLRRVLRAGGWEMVRVLNQRDVQNVRFSLDYLLADSAGRRGFRPALLGWLRSLLSRPLVARPLSILLAGLHQTGRMTVWARRRDAPAGEVPG